jgi:dihydrofolate synthase / folylpolyglutamate synthase
MNYDSSVRYLLSLGRELATPTQATAAKFDLENITVLAERLGHPERAYPSVHIAGTNGKGSTAAFLESILRHAGFRTGLNTSPHLEKINERIRINGEEISDQAFAERVDFAVFEVGLGGRLDATNILSPAITIITRVDFDHENFLGHSLNEIAAEKAGILKPGVPVVLAEQRAEAREVILTRAKNLACPVIEPTKTFRIDRESVQNGGVRARVIEAESGKIFELAPSLSGRFQLQNALSALAAARLLQDRGFQVRDAAFTQGIAQTVWPGRLEKLQSSPDVYCDGAHNPGAARELAHFLEQNFSGRKISLIYAALRDKAVDEVAGLLFPHATEVIFTAPRTSRAVSATQLAEIAGHHAAHFSVIPDAERAFEHALAEAAPEDAIFITGSLYLVGQLRHYWKSRARVHAR